MIQLKNDVIKVKENNEWSSVSSLTGPQGEQGIQGVQGEQGPQGIPGEPGYPTIQSGDAGKVLTVNDTEDAVEWAETVQGLDIIKTFDLEALNYQWPTLTDEEYARVKVGAAIQITGNAYPGLYICTREENDGTAWRFYNKAWTGNNNFSFINGYLNVGKYTKEVSGLYSENIYIFSHNQDYPSEFRNFIYGAQDVYQVPTFFPKNSGGGTSYYYGWLPLPQAGDGLVMNDTTGNMSMSCPIEREENFTPHTTTFDPSSDTMTDQGNDKIFYYNDNQTKVDNIISDINSYGTNAEITINYQYYGNTYTVHENGTLEFNLNDYYSISFNTEAGEFRVYVNLPSENQYGVSVWVPDSNIVIDSLEIDILESLGTYTYTTQLPIEAIECDKTTAGTYTLKCTVDAQGNKTYAWV